MRAVVCHAPHHIALKNRPVPLRGDGEVLVRIRRVGICGTDFHIYEGLHPFLSYPRVMGHELSATVVAAPDGGLLRAGMDVVVNPYLACGTCHACRSGKPNCCMNIAVLGVHSDGGMCEFLSLPPQNLIPSNGLSLDAAATVEFLAIGAHAVRRAGPIAGGRALVVGAGPIGLGTALFASIAGAEVTVMDRDVTRLEIAEARIGLTHAVMADETAAQALAEITSENGFDVVFDATGNRQSMQDSFGHVAHGGTCVLVGVIRDDITFADAEFHKREMALLASRNATNADFQQVMAAIASGAVPVDALITHRTTLERVVDDLPRWATDKTGLIKSMIEID